MNALNFDCGVYTITSPSGKVYVGSTKSFSRRWQQHRSLLRFEKHHCRPLQRAFAKYGEGQLVFAKIAIVPESELLAREQEQIEAIPADRRYNMAHFAGAPFRGRRHTDEARASMSAKKFGKVPNAETRRKLSIASKGKRLSAEVRARMSAARSGEKHPNWGKSHRKSTIQKMSLAALRRWADPIERAAMSIRMTGDGNPMWGRKLTAEHRAKVSASLVGKMKGENHHQFGKPLSADTKAKLSIALSGERNHMYGKRLGVERCAAIAAHNRTRIASAKTREKISAAFSGEKHPSAREILCVEAGITFGAISLAAAWLRENGKTKARGGNISSACAGKLPRAYGFTWRFADSKAMTEHAARETDARQIAESNASAIKVRQFRNRGGFKDDTDYIQVQPNGDVYVVKRNGFSEKTGAYDLDGCLAYVAGGDWIELEAA